jgi:thiol-disulfide isomerase/thioredoxin
MKRRSQTLIVACCSSALLLAGWQETPEVKPPANQDGWTWVVAPVQVADANWPAEAIEKDSGIYRLTVAKPAGVALLAEFRAQHQFPSPGSGIDYQLVLFDERGVRTVIGHSTSQGSGQVTTYKFQYKLDKGADEFRSVGVERIDQAGLRVISDAARKEAAAAGIATLPYPEIGKPYVFQLTDIDGNVIDSAELKGKVVLIDGWATWCRPCMQKMTELSPFYRKHHEAGLEIVGINFDEEVAKLKRGKQQRNMNWRHVHVPRDAAQRDLWYRVSTIRMLPRLLILNRDGVLVADVEPRELTQALKRYLDEAAPAAATQPAKP